MPDESRLQVRKNDAENTWADVGHKAGNESVPVKVTELPASPEPLPDEGNNPSTLLSFNAAGDLVYVDETIGATTYRQTFTRGDMTITSTLPISEFVEL